MLVAIKIPNASALVHCSLTARQYLNGVIQNCKIDRIAFVIHWFEFINFFPGQLVHLLYVTICLTCPEFKKWRYHVVASFNVNANQCAAGLQHVMQLEVVILTTLITLFVQWFS